MSSFATELFSAAGRLRRAPGFSLLVIFVLGIGLGGTIFMFGALKGYILSPLPFADSHELMHIENQVLAEDQDSLEVRPLDFLDYREQQRSFEALAGFYSGTVNLSGAGADRPERYDGAFITGNSFELLQVAPYRGRMLTSTDSSPAAPDVVLLGYSIWMHRYAGNPDIVGSSIRVNGRDATVVGVMPPEFGFPLAEQVWIPLRIDTTSLEGRGDGMTLEVFGRLADGVTERQAAAELNAIASTLASEHPETNAGRTVLVKPFAREFVDEGARRTIYTMTAAVVLILIMGCANTANLVLVRAARGQRELTIRSALGASRRQLVLRVLAECLVLTTVAAAFGWVIADIAGDAMMNALSAGDAQIPMWVDVSPDRRVLLFTVLAAIATTLLAGLLPALRGTRLNLNESLKEGARSTGTGRIGRGLVVFEIALSCVLLVSAGLMLRSVANLDKADLGIDSSNVLLSRMGLFEEKYPDDEARRRFFEELVEDLAAQPGVAEAFVATGIPGTQVYWTRIAQAGQGSIEEQLRRGPFHNITVATPGIFDALSIPIVSGRTFGSRDRAGGEPVAVITSTLAETLWPGEPAVGRRIALSGSGDAERFRTVVGVVGPVHLGQPDDPMRGGVFLPLSQNPVRFAYAAVRTSGDPMAFGDTMRRSVQRLDRDLPVYWLETLDYWIAYSAWTDRVIAVNFEIFGAIALILAAVGMYGVLAYSVAQRTREIGVRRALGADDGVIVRHMARQSFGQLGFGLGLGLLMAFGFARALQHMLVDVEIVDPVTYAGVVAVLVAVAVVAAAVPTWRALRVDPMVGLRQD